MQIIVKRKGTEARRRKSEAGWAIMKRYYEREVRDGSRARFPAPKEVIRKLYE